MSNRNQQILFIGQFFPKDLVKTVVYDSRGYNGLSNHNFEMMIIKGLMSAGVDLRCVTLPKMYSYPQFNRKLFTKKESYKYDDVSIVSAGFCNLIGINRFSQYRSLKKEIISQLDAFEGSDVQVIINTPNHQLIKALYAANAVCKKNLKTAVIVPDIPSAAIKTYKAKGLKHRIASYFNELDLEYTSKCDVKVLLTRQMTDFFTDDKPFIVMEGMVDPELSQKYTPADMHKKVLLYTGTLANVYGLKNLLDAFELLKTPDVELWICGSGIDAEYVKERAARNNAIKYLGFVTREQAMEYQAQASVLINPRTSEGEYTKYSFPSKTMEYLLSGKPVISNHLPGIPDEYLKYLYIPSDESVQSLADCIDEIFNIPSENIQKKAIAAREFVITQKSNDVQMKRIISLLSAK